MIRSLSIDHEEFPSGSNSPTSPMHSQPPHHLGSRPDPNFHDGRAPHLDRALPGGASPSAPATLTPIGSGTRPSPARRDGPARHGPRWSPREPVAPERSNFAVKSDCSCGQRALPENRFSSSTGRGRRGLRGQHVVQGQRPPRPSSPGSSLAQLLPISSFRRRTVSAPTRVLARMLTVSPIEWKNGVAGATIRSS